MNKALTLLLAAGVFLTVTAPVSALDLNPCPASADGLGKLCVNTNKPGDQVTTVLKNGIVGILVIAAILALFFLIYGGIRWILSGGDKGKVDEARKTIVAAIIGLIITFLAYFILSVVLNLFGLSFDNLKIPSLTGA